MGRLTDIFGDAQEWPRRRVMTWDLEGRIHGEHVYHLVQFEGEDAYDLEEDAPAEQVESAAKARRVVKDPAQATVISSALARTWEDNVAMEDRLHTVMLDIDLPIRVRETSPGRSHLFIDKELPWSDMVKLLRVLAEVGIVEEGYAGVSERRGACHLRLPWVTKQEPKPAEPAQAVLDQEEVF